MKTYKFFGVDGENKFVEKILHNMPNDAEKAARLLVNDWFGDFGFNTVYMAVDCDTKEVFVF